MKKEKIIIGATVCLMGLMIIGRNLAVGLDPNPSTGQGPTPPAVGTVDYVIGDRLDNLRKVEPVSEQTEGADYVARVRISNAGSTKFNTIDGLRPSIDTGETWEIISTPIVVDVLEYYKQTNQSTPPAQWVLAMLGGELDGVINNNRGYVGETIKNTGSVGVVFFTVIDLDTGVLATPENSEPVYAFLKDMRDNTESSTGVEYGTGIIFNWYNIENGQASSYRDDRGMPESELIQEINDGLQ